MHHCSEDGSSVDYGLGTLPGLAFHRIRNQGGASLCCPSQLGPRLPSTRTPSAPLRVDSILPPEPRLSARNSTRSPSQDWAGRGRLPVVSARPGLLQGLSTREVWRRGHRSGDRAGQGRRALPSGRDGLVLWGRWPVPEPQGRLGTCQEAEHWEKERQTRGLCPSLCHPSPAVWPWQPPPPHTHTIHTYAVHTHTPLSKKVPGTPKESEPQTPSSSCSQWGPR